MLDPEVFVEYSSGWGLVFCVVVCVEQIWVLVPVRLV